MFENIQPYLFVSVSILSSPESSKMENTHFNPLFEVGIITLTVCEFRSTCDEDQLRLAQMCVRHRWVHRKQVSDQFLFLKPLLPERKNWPHVSAGQCCSCCLTLRNASARCYKSVTNTEQLSVFMNISSVWLGCFFEGFQLIAKFLDFARRWKTRAAKMEGCQWRRN